MNQDQFKALSQRVRVAIELGQSIAVVGWKASNHDAFTRHLPSKKVVFYEKPPAALGMRTGLVILTKFVGHATHNRLKQATPVYPIAVGNGVIKEILMSCQDLWVNAPQPSLPVVFLPAVEHASASLPAEILQLTQPVEEVMSDMEKFVAAFLEASKKHDKGYVGKTVLGQLRMEHGIERTSPQLAKDGWLEKITSQGKKKAGWYKAGRKMLTPASQEMVEPTDPYRKVQFLIDQELPVQAEILELETKLKVAKKMLARIETAKEFARKVAEI